MTNPLETPADVAAELHRLADIVATFTQGHNPGPPNGDAVLVPEGGDLDAAIAGLVETGGIVELDAGAVYPGPVWLPARPAGSPLITIRTRGALLDRRLTEADRPLLATIAATNTDGAIRAEGTAGYTLDGLHLTMTVGTHEVVVIENSEGITLDRILFVAPSAGQKRIVRGNGRWIMLTRSHLNGGAYAGQDSQAFCAWEGAGPYTITDNYLAASGENILFGGGDNLGGEATNPADILVAGNDIHKPQEWRDVKGSVKNLFELKNATRVIVRDNRFDGNWGDAQSGWGIVFTPVNQDGRAPWAIVKDVLFERNYVTNSEHGINILGRAYSHISQQSSGFVIRKNVFEVEGKFLQVSSGLIDLTLEDNVVENGNNTGGLYEADVLGDDGSTVHEVFAIYTLRWNRNVHRDPDWGIHSEVGIGTLALEARTQSYEFRDNQFLDMKFTYPESTTSIDAATFDAAKQALLAELGRA